MNLFPISLENKVVLITGASSGFGEDAAWLFAEEGCKVVLAARRIDRLRRLASKIQDAGGEAIAVPVDIVNADDVDNMVKATLDLYDRIDILFNNAGIGRVGWFEEHSVDRDINTLIQVNLVGMMQVTRMVLPHMIARREGHIINMISVAGLISPPLISSYSASKYGAKAFTDSLRREIAPFGIKVSGIYPGPASTEFGSHIGRNKAYQSIRNSLNIRMTSDYVAHCVLNVAKRPRRSLIIPWWFRIITTFDTLFPVVVDWILYLFSRIKHKLD
ncbi:MAG TPA: SDR family NAD(P)-dependent oxidoreductase [Anaerolineales bacterium]|jgi:short-subunit dehydrogenase|nr:SDR family NAD(P)-dependent oxidoreductase [Anaerolineales bacterium]HRK89546.1 SDR family NAD(P)-dependent oxidoreductase [Anaerolineales bacterium]